MTTDTPFTVQAAPDPEGTRLVLSGRVDRDAEEALLTAYRETAETGATRVILDFGAASYINSSGLAAIVAVLADARERDIRVAARGLTPHYRHLFEITRLADLVEVESSPEGMPERGGVA